MTEQERLRSQTFERAVLAKVLTRLVPFIALLYMFNILDRGNVSIAALTMQKDLRFSDTVYGLGAGIFFIGYFIFEVPSNLIMQRVGARLWIARIMFSWGAVSTGMMFVHSATSFYILRFLLGVAEAGFYPGIMLYFTYWLPGSLHAQMIARFLALTAILGLFGGPLGGLLLTLSGVMGLAGWQWLFLLEGIPSLLLSFTVLAFLPDGPAQAAWLSQEEKTWIAERLADEAQNDRRVEHLTLGKVLAEPRVLLLCLIFFITATGGNAISFFGPQLLKARSGGAWSDSFVATILIVPALVGAIAMLLAARHSDRTGQRRNHVMLGYCLAGLSFIACVYTGNAWWTLAALAFNALGERIAAGSYWAITTNLMGARAAAGGIAFINSVGNLGGFFGPTLMGTLKQHTHGGYVAGLTVAGLLYVAAAGLGCLLQPPEEHHRQ